VPVQDSAAEPLLLVLLKALSLDLFAPPKSTHQHHQHHHHPKKQQKQQQQQEGFPTKQPEQQRAALTQQQEQQLSVAAKDLALGLWHTVAELSQQGLQEQLSQPVRDLPVLHTSLLPCPTKHTVSAVLFPCSIPISGIIFCKAHSVQSQYSLFFCFP